MISLKCFKKLKLNCYEYLQSEIKLLKEIVNILVENSLDRFKALK